MDFEVLHVRSVTRVSPYDAESVNRTRATLAIVGGAVASWLVLDSGSSGPGSGPGRGHCVVFLGKTLYSHGASLYPRVYMGTGENAGGNPAMD